MLFYKIKNRNEKKKRSLCSRERIAWQHFPLLWRLCDPPRTTWIFMSEPHKASTCVLLYVTCVVDFSFCFCSSVICKCSQMVFLHLSEKFHLRESVLTSYAQVTFTIKFRSNTERHVNETLTSSSLSLPIQVSWQLLRKHFFWSLVFLFFF